MEGGDDREVPIRKRGQGEEVGDYRGVIIIALYKIYVEVLKAMWKG